MELIMSGTKRWYMEEEEKLLQEIGDEAFEERLEAMGGPCDPCFTDYPNFRIERYRDHTTFTPLNESAEGWWLDKIEPECKTKGDSYIVENRFAPEIIKGINYAITGR
jgi:hypothetical protein|tara:strand:- start:57 stop:380 length:324 start_codon:yes stop_codon:yes gene_type:complete